MKKKISRNVRRRLSFLLPITLIILIVSLSSCIKYFYNIYSLKKEEILLQQKYDDLKNEEDILTDEITRLKDPEYIAKYARENYYYTKNGEYVIKINEEENTEEKMIKSNTNKTYYIIGFTILVLIFLLAILINRLKKKKDN